MKLTAQQVYDRLVNDYNIKEKTGYIRFNIGEVSINATTRDSVGNLIQNWVKAWLREEDIEAEENPNTQTAPDFFLDLQDKKKGWLEIKAFYNSPNFDVADFVPYGNNLPENIHVLDETFLIFQYDLNEETGEVSIVNVWLKKIWEICGSSNNYALNVQAKAPDKNAPAQKQIFKIRPITWYSPNGQFKPFGSVEKFLCAIEELRYSDPRTRNDITWKRRVEEAYLKAYGRVIHLPRWTDIVDEVRPKCKKKTNG